MAKEIERKFLVLNDSYKALAFKNIHILQGYLSTHPEATVRVRCAGEKAFLTIKGVNRGAVRDEWEVEIDPVDAHEMIEICARGRVLDKIRHYVDYEGYIWEVDEYYGKNAGLVVAEVEMKTPDEQPSLPPFVGKEVTGEEKYYNSNLV